MDYQATAKAYSQCTDIDKVFSILEHLLKQEKCLDRDLAIAIIGQHITLNIVDTKYGDELIELVSHDIFAKMWGGIQDVLEKLANIKECEKLILGWANGDEITLD